MSEIERSNITVRDLQNHEATIPSDSHTATIIHINSSSHTATMSEIERSNISERDLQNHETYR